jgi:hypothetical protein
LAFAVALAVAVAVATPFFLEGCHPEAQPKDPEGSHSPKPIGSFPPPHPKAFALALALALALAFALVLVLAVAFALAFILAFAFALAFCLFRSSEAKNLHSPLHLLPLHLLPLPHPCSSRIQAPTARLIPAQPNGLGTTARLIPARAPRPTP